ncbi:glycosyltransferase [Paenibacillus algorifonticola]|uniref:glycosyltransferase n=1 Tax=Paenibacillus algorifonticola TaxID=684063 RepID=UPI003D2E01CD
MREPVTYSVVIPVYNDEQMLYDTYKRLKRIIPPIGENYELIFVNDNSTDRSADMLRVFCAADIRVRAIHFASSFGYEAAVAAGADHASGEQKIVMEVSDRFRSVSAGLQGSSPFYVVRAKEGFTHSPLWDFAPESAAC